MFDKFLNTCLDFKVPEKSFKFIPASSCSNMNYPNEIAKTNDFVYKPNKPQLNRTLRRCSGCKKTCQMSYKHLRGIYFE